MARIRIEVLALSVSRDQLMVRRVDGALRAGEAPDRAALRLAGAGEARVSHSTSWRSKAGRLWLTYAVLPDPSPLLGRQALEPAVVVSSGRPSWPSPEGLHFHHIAAHAVWHLDILRGCDPTVAQAAALDPELWDAIAELARSVRTGVDAEVHREIPGASQLSLVGQTAASAG